ncbi:MAG TPA: MOSC domain-containing protein [Sulfurimonas sp.]|nr:MOSC domain-containing protein [Sulfurimonas sp.]
MTLSVNILHIYTSPQHHYFTRKKFNIGDAQTLEHEEVYLEVNKGIKDDRFEFSTYPLTFMSEEVMKDVCSVLDLAYEPKLFRRNIVISGINLNQLIGKSFQVGDVIFEGMEHCSPCTWMNAVMKKGAYRQMSGRGGLRVRVLKNGKLKTGTNILITPHEFDLLDPKEAKKRPKLP